MDALLPSEIARLVLGYLQEQKCEEAAKIFMETSPLLQECRVVSQRGGRYSTKVGGLSLMDILDKYCLANVMVQEKLSKVSDSEQMKQCNDILEQLRYLLEGSSRGHRFVVNISVPQNSPSGSFGSPIVSGSSRKRHHSHSEKGKRATKSLNNLIEKSLQQNFANQNCDVEATPLESLPGYKSSDHTSLNHNYLENNVNVNNVSEKTSNKTNFINSSNEQTCNVFATNNPSHLYSAEPNIIFPNIINSNCKDQSTETVEKNNIEPIKDKCTAGTSTEELMSYTSAEVQTGPCDLLDTESDVNHDESIQNLGILTKELLNRTEIHERIAENINKAILPVETSFREENTCQNQIDVNSSLLTDLDNAIKSVVQATETDPVFEGFLHEIFSVGETDTSPDEDSDGRQIQGLNQPSPNTVEAMDVEENFGTNEPLQPNMNNEIKGPEVPLKQRLRNSSKPQHINNEDEDKESNTLLDNANEEAVMNIVNVIANRRNSLLNNEQTYEINPAEDPLMAVGTVGSVCSTGTEVEKSNEEVKPKSTKKNTRKSKPKPKPTSTRSEPKPEPEVATMPTLILCSERDVGFFPEKVPKTNSHGYVPIVPKPVNTTTPSVPEPPATIYLRTVNVPRHLVNQSTIEATQQVNPLLQKALQMQQQSPQKQLEPNDDPIVIPIVVADNKLPVTSSPVVRPSGVSNAAPTANGESITLYAGETENAEMKMSPISSLPIISVDESILGMAAGTGLSPFFKVNLGNPITEEVEEAPRPEELAQLAVVPISNGNEKLDADARAKADPPELIPIEAKVVDEAMETQENDGLNRSKSADAIITRRTPKTLLKARAKNNRLSLSTPRRRNSHVRALDFNTPVKLTGTARKQPQSCVRTKSVCRAGLFKSPPFESEVAAAAAAAMNVHSVLGVQTVKKVRTVSPIKPAFLRVPIATRSPAPKLQGNWAKVTGIGLILEGDTSTSESSPEKSQPEEKAAASTTTTTMTTVTTTTVVEKKSWDSDLRKIIGTAAGEEEQENSKLKSAKKGTTRKRNVDEKAKVSEKPKEKKKPTKESDVDKKELLADEANGNVEMNLAANKKNEITPPAAPAVSKRLASIKQSTELEEKQQKSISEAKKASPITRMPDLLDLETPRKEEPTFYVPPTPRILNTPGDSLIKSARSKNRNTSIKDCVVDTPDFPVTPCIVHTPKIVDEENHEKKPSPYYEPEEQPQPKPKELVSAEKIVVQETTTTVTIQRSIVELQESKKIDVIQYQEMPQDSSAEIDEKDAEVGIMSEDTSKETIEEEESVDEPTAANSDSDSDGNESDSSSSSSSTNTSSSSSSSCSSADSSPAKSVQENRGNDVSTAESELESPEVSTVVQVPPAEPTNECSPQKVFSVMEEGEVKETPAKEENGLVEAEISETPSVSNAERAQRRDSLTNLTSKISAIITTSQSDQAQKVASEETCTVSSSEKNQAAAGARPKIIKVENIAPTDGIAVQVSKLLHGDLHKAAATIIHQQQQQMDNAKLGLTLEEKRLRVLAKFKEAASNVPKKSSDGIDGKQKKAPVTRKSVEAEKVVSSTTDASKGKIKPTGPQVEPPQNEKVEAAEEATSKVAETVTDDEKKSEETKETKKSKGKTSPRKKVPQEVDQVQGEKPETDELNKVEEVVINSVPLAPENSKGISKAKVDQVKRDLFSDEETNDQRTTRSQTARRSTDTQKSVESQESSPVQESSQEKIPGVLECLELIPANKGEKEHDLSNKSISEEGFSNLQTNCLDNSFVYDESVPIKKRKRKYSSSELDSEYHFVMNDDEPCPYVEILKLMPLEELFKLSPKIKKKTQSPKKSPSKIKRSKTSNKSSPTKSSRCKKTRSEEKKKSCKRKNTSPSKGGTQVEKKPKTDPQTLFNRIVIDEFLKSVHVPE